MSYLAKKIFLILASMTKNILAGDENAVFGCLYRTKQAAKTWQKHFKAEEQITSLCIIIVALATVSY